MERSWQLGSFEDLRDFIRTRMRMSHIYQPVMIKELLQSGGKASIRNIAAAYLSRDESQLEYYEQITKDMPGKVLGKHGIVERNGDEYRLTIDPSLMSSEERDELVRLCDEAITAYLQKRGTAVCAPWVFAFMAVPIRTQKHGVAKQVWNAIDLAAGSEKREY